MDLRVPERWEPFIRSQVQSGRYASEAEVVDEALGLLMRRDQQQEDEHGERARVEALLLQGLESGPASPMLAEDWDAVEREAQQLIADRKARQSR